MHLIDYSQIVKGYKLMMEKFPLTRLRRNRRYQWQRDLVAEIELTPKDLVLPIFVHDEGNENLKSPSMPGVDIISLKNLPKIINKASSLGVTSVNIFPRIDGKLKTEDGAEGYKKNNLICRAIKTAKDCADNIGIIADVALDPYTSHGHDGLFENNNVDNDKTLELLAKQALLFAEAGVDIIAPSDMMDGRIKKLRNSLDAENYTDIGIISYSAKYASSLYGPFRDTVGSTSSLGKLNKKTYQCDFRNSKEAIREAAHDIKEGADMLMVKPAMFYLDIIKNITDKYNIPTLAYQVSGEYSMIKAAAQNGWLNEFEAFYESLIAIKRAGATGIMTYYAIDMAQKL